MAIIIPKWEHSLIGAPWTFFFCHFWWNGKASSFDVFNDIKYCVHGTFGVIPLLENKCHWQVQEDGFFLGFNHLGKLYFKNFMIGKQ
ncbi:hypothetical protein T459_34890 [Capsicum annuum]|uniref:Uncharacterized protein n=1 Tax=Capsicum annuum TaxID=4072 RepID=A0A2G2XUR3_CAPAN|nr:hypothetical protein T459_34890 [Capsicum annuum]